MNHIRDLEQIFVKQRLDSGRGLRETSQSISAWLWQYSVKDHGACMEVVEDLLASVRKSAKSRGWRFWKEDYSVKELHRSDRWFSLAH